MSPEQTTSSVGSAFPQLVRPLSWIALALLLLGAFDPMEGSVVIAVGAVLAAWAAAGAASRQRRLLLRAAVLVVVGVAALFGMSALGGIGGDTGRSYWWALLFLPYPVGWIMALTGAFELVAELRRRASATD
jgi:NO-binding membrane sensor protein with MHYT domain